MNETSKPKVLMLTSTLPRWEGDTEPRFVLDLAKHLSKDFDIELLAPHATGAARREVLEGVPLTRFRYWIPRWQSVAYEGGVSWRLRENPLRLFQVPFFMLALVWNIVRRLRHDGRVDLIHAHWIIPQGLAAVIARGLSGSRVPIVCTSHGGDLFGLRGALWNTLKGWVLQRSNAVTVVSNAMAARVKEIAAGVDPLVIPMGTDLRNQFTPPRDPREPPLHRLLFVGRLVEKKGVTYLLDALRQVLQTHPSVVLDIVGHGPLRPELETKADRLGLGDSVRFMGPVRHADLPARYQEADIAVFPFIEASSGDQEGFGLVTVEAMGCGCPVVVSALPAVRDVISSPEIGVLVPPADAAELAQAIRSIIESPAESLKRAQNARCYAKSRFDWSVSSSHFGETFIRLLANTSG